MKQLLPLFFTLIATSAMAQVLPRMPNGPTPENKDIRVEPLKVPTIGELNKAVLAYRAGDYENALKISDDLAKRGDANAAALVGFLYENGMGVEKSYEMAAKYYRQGSLQNSSDAMMGMGRIWVLDNDVVTKEEVDNAYKSAIKAKRNDAYTPYGDFLMAQSRFQLAAAQYDIGAQKGDVNAAYSLAILLDDGDENIPDDFIKARTLLKQAADGGIPAAMADYGLLIYQGRGGDKNLAQAAEWFKKSAEAGDKTGAFYWALVNAKGEGVKQDIPTAKKYAEIAKSEVPDAERLYQQILNYEKLKGNNSQNQKQTNLKPKSKPQK